MSPKQFRKVIEKWRMDEYKMACDFPEPMTAKKIESFMKKLPFNIPKKHLEYTFEFGGKFNVPYTDFPDSIIPGNFNLELDFGELYLMDPDEIIGVLKDHRMLLGVGEFDDLEAKPSPGVADCWLHEKWIPFAANGGGDYLCFDLAPTKEGTKGQVIAFAHETGLRPKFANSMREFFDRLAETYKEELIYLGGDNSTGALRKMRKKDFPTF